MDIKKITELYVLRNWDRWEKYWFYDKLISLGYDFENETLNQQVTRLSNEEKIEFVWEIERYIDKLELNFDRKLFMMLIVVYTHPLSLNLKKEPLYSCARKLAKRLIKEYSEPWFIVEIIERHWEIKVSDLLEN